MTSTEVAVMTAPVVVAASPAEIADLPAEQRGQLVTHALIESRQWLAVATKGTDPTPIAEFKAWAATVAEMTRQKGLAAEIQADALEMVRRAERGIGVAIRNGQEAGEVLRRGQTNHSGNQYVPVAPLPEQKKGTTEMFAGGAEQTDIYAVTDNVTDAEFDAAITDARAEGNLSRANVVRKVKGVKAEGLSPVEKLSKIRALAGTGMTSQQIAAEIGAGEPYVRNVARQNQIKITADELLRGTRRVRIDHNHIVSHLVMTLEVVTADLDRVDLAALDDAQMQNWTDSLTTTTRALNRFVKQMKEKVA